MADDKFKVDVPGYDEEQMSMLELRALAVQKIISPQTMVTVTGSGKKYPAAAIPELYSDKSMTTALILSIFVGALGIDRFYLGYTALGVLKLLTLGGCGVWALIDLVLIAMRKLNDAQGRPLQ
jgi:hypothetical protein